MNIYDWKMNISKRKEIFYSVSENNVPLAKTEIESLLIWGFLIKCYMDILLYRRALL